MPMLKKSESTEKKRIPVVNLPNALTLVRILLVPVFIWLLLVATVSGQWAALAVFIIAALTDQIDGHIARSRGLVTDFGKIADPIADKALVLSAFVILTFVDRLPWWFTVLVIVRELGITLMRMVLVRRGVVLAASSGGKIKTALQMLLVVLIIIPWESFAGEKIIYPVGMFSWFVLFLALFITVGTGIEYVYNTFKANSTSGQQLPSTSVTGQADALTEVSSPQPQEALGSSVPVVVGASDSTVEKDPVGESLPEISPLPVSAEPTNMDILGAETSVAVESESQIEDADDPQARIRARFEERMRNSEQGN